VPGRSDPVGYGPARLRYRPGRTAPTGDNGTGSTLPSYLLCAAPMG